MAYMPPAVPSRTTVEAVLTFAQNVAHDFGSAPAIFSSGERAASELSSELTSYQQLTSALNNNGSSSQTSPLTANLIPCRDALENLASIRRKYPHGRDAKLGFADNLQWNTKDKKEFEAQVAKLREDTGRLRELVRELQRSAIESLRNHQQQRHQQQPQQEQRGVGHHARACIYGDTVLQTTVSIASSSTSGFTPQPRAPRNNPYAPSKSKANLPMCPNGPGCRTPSCGFEYNHPRAEACENGKNCGIPGCQLFHPKAAFCDKGPSCPMVGCEKAHPWPREPPTPAGASVYSYAPSDRSFASPNQSVSDMSTFSDLASQRSVSDLSSVGGSQSSQSFERDSSRGFSQQQSQQRSWGGAGGAQAASMRPSATGPSTYTPARAQSTAELQGSPRGPSNRNNYTNRNNNSGQQEWCKLRFDCPGGYNGQCPLRHPRRTPCWDFQRGSCPRGASCTFYHGAVEVSAQASGPTQTRAPGQYVQAYAQAQVGAQYAELPGASRSQPVAELPGNYVAELPARRY